MDVRTGAEYKEVHIKGSQQLHWRAADGAVNAGFTLDLAKVVRKNQTIVLICQSGRRSKEAADAAAQRGYSRVFNVLGGIEGCPDQPGWRQLGLPLE